MLSTEPAENCDAWNDAAWAAAQVASSSVPAFLARGDGTVVAVNAAAAPLMRRGTLPLAWQAHVADTRFKNRVQSVRAPIQDERTTHDFELTLLPLPAGHVLAVGRDTRLEANLISALVASRDLYRDLALNFTDFAFETDAIGAFSWVSPNGLVGFAAEELHGARARDVFGASAAACFSSRTQTCSLELQIHSKAGDEAYISATSSPIFDPCGVWCGARGVVRDVTAIKRLEREAILIAKREKLIAAVVDAVRAQVEPRRMMLAAADALAAATDSDAVSISTTVSAMTVTVGRAERGLKHVVESTTSYRDAVNGVLHLTRSAARGAYGDAERALIEAVNPHIGVALALVEALGTLRTTDRDPASGLPTRDAFLRAAGRKHAAAARAGRDVACFLVSCADANGASPLCDETRDEVLTVVGRRLEARCGDGGVAGKFNEDEFVLFAGAVGDQRDIADELYADLTNAIGHLEGVTVAIGCAASSSDMGETVEMLAARAACALRTARNAGMAAVASADLVVERDHAEAFSS